MGGPGVGTGKVVGGGRWAGVDMGAVQEGEEDQVLVEVDSYWN